MTWSILRRVRNLSLAYPAVWFVRFTAWARMAVSTPAFRCGLISRTQHEQDKILAAELRRQAASLLVSARAAS